MQSNAFLKPRIIDVQSTSPFHAKVVMEPFERGYGHTLGNALRRVLLSSMPGYAPTEVKIDGRAARVFRARRRAGRRRRCAAESQGRGAQLHNRDHVTLKLAKNGEGPVTAADIEADHDVEIINPEHLIAHLTAGARSRWRSRSRRVAAISRRPFASSPTEAAASATSCSMPRSRRCAASATRSRARASSSVPTSTSW